MERFEKYCNLVIALENGEFDRDRQRKDSDSTSSGSRSSSESSKFPFNSQLPDQKSPLPSNSRDTSMDSLSIDEKHNSFTRRKTAVLATENASFLLNTNKSRLQSIVVPNSFEHQFLVNSSTQASDGKANRRVVPRQTSLAKIWDTVDSDEEENEDNSDFKSDMKGSETEINELDEQAVRRSIALCQEVSLEPIISNPSESSSIRPQDIFSSEEHDSDNEEQEDEIRAIRIEEAIRNKMRPQPHRRNRTESFVQYVDRMLSTSGNIANNPKEDIARLKSVSVFSMESDYPLANERESHDKRVKNERSSSTGSALSSWFAKRGSSHENTKTNDNHDLEMGDIARNMAFSKDSFSYLSDCICAPDDPRNTLVTSLL